MLFGVFVVIELGSVLANAASPFSHSMCTNGQKATMFCCIQGLITNIFFNLKTYLGFARELFRHHLSHLISRNTVRLIMHDLCFNIEEHFGNMHHLISKTNGIILCLKICRVKYLKTGNTKHSLLTENRNPAHL